MRLNFWVIGCLRFKSRYTRFLFNSCFDDAYQSCKSACAFTTVKQCASLIKLPRNLLRCLREMNPASKLKRTVGKFWVMLILHKLFQLTFYLEAYQKSLIKPCFKLILCAGAFFEELICIKSRGVVN